MEEEKKQDGAPQAPPKPNMCSTGELFQFLHGSDRLLLWIGSIAALSSGLAFPAFVFFFGKLTDSFDPTKDPADTLCKHL